MMIQRWDELSPHEQPDDMATCPTSCSRRTCRRTSSDSRRSTPWGRDRERALCRLSSARHFAEAAEIMKDALALPSEAREALAGSLLDNLDTEVNEDAEDARATEVNRRFRPRISVMLSSPRRAQYDRCARCSRT